MRHSIATAAEMSEQALKLAQKPHVVISTPGRMKDHLEGTKGFNLNHLQFLVMPQTRGETTNPGWLIGHGDIFSDISQSRTKLLSADEFPKKTKSK